MASVFLFTTIFILLSLSFLSEFSSSIPMSISQNTQNLKQRSLIDNTQLLSSKPPTSKKKTFSTTKNQTNLTKPKKPDSVILTNGHNATKAKLNRTLESISKQPNSTKPSKSKSSLATKTSNSDAQFTTLFTSANEDNIAMISNFRDFLPDLELLSQSSKSYIYAANRGIAEGVKPIIGNTFAPKIAPLLSVLTILIPLLLLVLLFNHLRSHPSLHSLLIFIQGYLCIYFATLSALGLVTGLDPLNILYKTSPTCFAWVQAMQTMVYMVYLVVQLAHLVVIFSRPSDEGVRGLGLVQMVIGLGIGVHYYVAMYYMMGEEPRDNWRVHGVYALCFVMVCVCARVGRRKKVYERDGEFGKLS